MAAMDAGFDILFQEQCRTMKSTNTQPQPRHTDGKFRDIVLPKPLRAPLAPVKKAG